MSMLRLHLRFTVGILVFILLGGMISVSAEAIPDLKGSWTAISCEQFSPDGGFENVTGDFLSYHITGQDGRAYVGEQTFYDVITGENVTEKFSGVLSPDGLTFEKDNEGSGISFGEIGSDNEFFITMMFPERGPMILFFHMVKSGTQASPSGNVPDLMGTWNLTHNRKNASSSSGLLTIDQQQGTIWSGTEEIQDEDGTLIHEPIAGTVRETGRIFATSADGAFMFGLVTGNDTIQSAFIIPGDTDGTYVIDRTLTKNGTSLPPSELSYPDLNGDWQIENRKVIENGTISDVGPVSDVWYSYANQTGPFFDAHRYNTSESAVQEITFSGVFGLPDEAFLTCANSMVMMYHVIDNSTIEAVVNRKDNNASLYLDLLTRKSE